MKAKGKIILASASPRRIEMFSSRNIEVTVRPADVDETAVEGAPPHIIGMYNALKKALKIKETEKDGIIIAADTIVYDGRILGKPKDKEDAFNVLRSLRNKTHSVITGVAVAEAENPYKRVFFDRTFVTFGDYSDEDIQQYIATEEPMDKAGSYAIQGRWSEFVTSVDGDYSNVIGLPWNRLKSELKNFGVELTAEEI